MKVHLLGICLWVLCASLYNPVRSETHNPFASTSHLLQSPLQPQLSPAQAMGATALQADWVQFCPSSMECPGSMSAWAVLSTPSAEDNSEFSDTNWDSWMVRDSRWQRTQWVYNFYILSRAGKSIRHLGDYTENRENAYGMVMEDAQCIVISLLCSSGQCHRQQKF